MISPTSGPAYLMENYALGLNDEDPVSGYSRKATINGFVFGYLGGHPIRLNGQ